MAPVVRRRTKALLVVAGLLLVGVVGLAWFLVGNDDPAADGTAAGAPGATADPAAGPGATEPTTAPAPTTAEAVAALGAPVARVEARDGFLVRTCTFWSSGDRYLLVQVSRGVAASREQFELSRLPGDRAVAGIGQAARWTRDTGLLDVLDGGARFQVGLFTPAGTPAAAAEPPARLEAAARAVAAHL
jgi:pyruvate/2-oxoglutarate dehydrogenase complex dihydrolipoamide acyltransferase (E2) component